MWSAWSGGIRNASQVSLLSPHVHAVVAGSVFVDIIRSMSPHGPEAVRCAIEKKARDLTLI
jgi:tryptophan synthase alpha subunit